MKDKPSIIFMGTPEFSVPSLEAIHEKYNIKAVVTVPDKPKGRGKKVLPSPVKEKALELGIPVLQPEKLKDEDFAPQLKQYEPDIMVVIAFRILPARVFNISKIATFNIHGSLLPKFRGAAPINWAILNGEKESGLTSFVLKEKVDTGDMLLQSKIKIPENCTAGDLHDMLMPMAADLSMQTIELLLSGNYELKPQDNSMASPAPKIFNDFCEINWDKPSKEIRNHINGVSPVPGAWTIWNDKRIKIKRAGLSTAKTGMPGSFLIDNGSFTVSCGNGCIEILEIQMPGKKNMKIKDFLAGYRAETEGLFIHDNN